MLTKSPARAEFKRHFGQANHYLVTSLVALSELESSDGARAAEELRTSWNPRDKRRSIARTRDFITRSFLGSAVDSIDLYISLLNRKPKAIANEGLIRDLDGAGRSVMQKCEKVGAHFFIDDVTRSLVRVLVTWRNNVMHELAENEVDSTTRDTLRRNAARIQSDYRHLVVAELADKAERGSDLTFKEAASLIAATHNFVEAVDSEVLKTFDPRSYCIEAVSDQLVDGKGTERFKTKYYSFQGETRKRFVQNWLANRFGFDSVAPEILEACCAIVRRREG